MIGSDGVFATNLQNGAVMALPNAHADREQTAAGYALDPNRHNEQVVDYFLAAGVPRDQIGGVHTLTLLSSSGYRGEPRAASPKVDGYISVLQRKIDNYPVVDSVAWARMSEQGRAISEAFYWPAIPAKALADARRLEEVLGRNSDKSAFLARLPANLPPGNVVIRHSSATVERPFEVFASYDVLEQRTSPASGIPGYPSGTRLAISATILRHFDVDGVERRLPQETPTLETDYPTAKKPH
jgi:hypothetical protein